MGRFRRGREGDNADPDDDNDGWADTEEIRQGRTHIQAAVSRLIPLRSSSRDAGRAWRVGPHRYVWRHPAFPITFDS